jgi:hypothetical protein
MHGTTIKDTISNYFVVTFVWEEAALKIGTDSVSETSVKFYYM